MPVTISRKDYRDLIHQTQCQQNLNHDDDKFDITYQYPERLGQGAYRRIDLRQGIELEINRYQLHDDVIVQHCERSHPIEYIFVISGQAITGKPTPISVAGGQYKLFGSGMAPVEKWKQSATEPIMRVNANISPEAFQTFLGECDLTDIGLEHLIRPSNRCFYHCMDTTSVVMQTVLHQILHCPFQAITKKVYLESKVWELMALLIEDERERHQDKRSTPSLKSDDVDRIHHARDILKANLDNPPSLTELARLIGSNEYTLKRGFREVFGTTAFTYLHEQRMEYAKQLLLAKKLNVGQVAGKLGYASQSRFALAFRKKFGVNPKAFIKENFR